MELIFPGIAAAAVAFCLNRILVDKMGIKAVTSLIPAVEESLKSFIPFMLGAPILYSHAVFGTAELIYETFTTGNSKGLLGSLVSFLTHLFFGMVTIVFFETTGILILSVLAAAAGHSIWNRLITYIYTR